MRLLKFPFSYYSSISSRSKKCCTDALRLTSCARFSSTVNLNQHVPVDTKLTLANKSGPSELVEKYRIYCEIDSCKDKNPDEVIRILEKAKASNVDLSFNASLAGLQACQESYKYVAADLAFWIYGRFKTRNVPTTIQVFEKMMKICSKHKLASEAVRIFEDYREAKYESRNSIYIDLLIALAANGNDRSSFEHLQKYYKEYAELSKTHRWRIIGPQLYFSIADAFCRNKDGTGALDILMNMTEASHEPTARLCAPLLQTALFHHDTKVLRVLASWYANTFNERMEYGILNNMLQIAASHGDGQLALVAFQMLASSGHDASKHNYFCLVKALLKSEDLISAIEALQEMEKRGYVLHTDKMGVYSEYQSLKSLLVHAFQNPPKSLNASTYLDQIYYALVDQVKKGGQRVPRIVLDSIVEASGKLDLMDRAFATFQEYSEVFQIEPNVDSYNALLTSVAVSKSCRMEQLLSIFQDLETIKNDLDSNSTGPNSASFTILLDGMIKLKDWRVLDDVLDHMSALSIQPEPRILRLLAVILARRRKWKSVDKIMGLMKALYGDNGIPQYFQEKIDQLRNAPPSINHAESKA